MRPQRTVMAASERGADSVRAVVVDDEPTAREVVTTLLAEHPSVQVVGEATNGKEVVNMVRRLKPDLLFLDIQMPDQDGFRVLEALGDDVPRGVVFVTAHDEHAIRAFELHALDYVLKPFGRPRFDAAVARAVERLSALDALSLQRTLASMADGRRARGEAPSELAHDEPTRAGDGARPTPLRRLGVRQGSRITLVEVDSIDWIEADGDYVRIHAGRAHHLVLQRLHALEEALEPGMFVRVHRSVLVRAARIRELHR